MCDNVINETFLKQTSTETEIFKPNGIRIPYLGPTMGGETSLVSKSNQKSTISESVSFEVTGPICDKKTFIETSGIVNIKKLNSGPYQNIGEGIEYRELFFDLEDLSMNVIIRYYFDPSKICTVIDGQSKELDPNFIDHPFMITIDASGGGISYDTNKYKVLNNNDPNNVNKLFDDLNNSKYLASYNPTWKRFYDVIPNSLFEQTDFGQKVDKEFQRIYCKSKSTSNSSTGPVSPIQSEYPYLVFQEKIDRLKKLGDIQVYFSKNLS